MASFLVYREMLRTAHSWLSVSEHMISEPSLQGVEQCQMALHRGDFGLLELNSLISVLSLARESYLHAF